jgi:hypothetical protein
VPSWRHGAAIAGAAVLHVTLVLSVVGQAPETRVPPVSPRFLTAPLFFDAVSWPGPGGDFYALYHAGLQARRGQSPHDMASAPGDPPYFFRYIYSPALAQTLGRLITALPPRGAYLVWVGVIETCLLIWLVVLWRAAAPMSVRTLAVAVLLASQPYVLELHMGQFTFVAVALTLLAARHARGLVGGATWLAGVMIKTFPLVVFPAFYRAGARGALTGGVAGAAVVLLSSWLTSTGEGHLALGTVDTMGGPHPGAASVSQAIYACVLSASGIWLPGAVPWLPAIVMAFALGLTSWLVLQRDGGVVLGCCALLLTFFASYLHVWEHHYAAVLLICVVALVEMSASNPPADVAVQWRLAIAVIVLALPSPFVLAGPTFQSWSVATWVLLSASRGLPALLALAAVLHALGKDRARAVFVPTMAGSRGG